MSDEIFVLRGGNQSGPFNRVTVQQLVDTGRLSREDLGWYQGLGDWQPINELLKPAAAKRALPAHAAPPQVQPPAAAEVIITGVRISFWNTVVLLVQIGLAAVPALLLIYGVFYALIFILTVLTGAPHPSFL